MYSNHPVLLEPWPLAWSLPTLKPKLCFSPKTVAKISCECEECSSWWSQGAGEGGCAEPGSVCWPCGCKAGVYLPAVRCLWCSCLHPNCSPPSPPCSAQRNRALLVLGASGCFLCGCPRMRQIVPRNACFCAEVRKGNRRREEILSLGRAMPAF